MALQIRKPTFDFSAVPHKWAGDNLAATQIANGVNLLFPAGERFFVRSVKYFLDGLDDQKHDALKQRAKGFFGQEGRHAHAHTEFNEVLRAQGYDLDGFLDFYERSFFSFMERITSPELRLAATAASEHFTAIMAHGLLEPDSPQRDGIHPTMFPLLAWHAAEEIEHKSVAFDVLQQVNPSYPLRMAGLALATVTLGGMWLAATTSLLRQDGMSWRKARADLRTLPKRDNIAKRVFLAGIRAYVRRDFHPDQIENYHLASDYFASIGEGFGD